MTDMPRHLVERALRRDRWIVGFGLIVLFLLAWAYLLGGAGTGMSLAQMTSASLFPHSDRIGSAVALERWGVAYAAGMVGMWWVMMVAMMTPSVAPIILLQAQAARHAEAKGAENAPALRQTGTFAAGYLLIWLVFSGAATFLQWALEAGGLLSTMAMGSQSVWLSASLLFAAGVYQFSPIKNFCLRHCQAPAAFLSRHWRPGTGGALRMGTIHGAYCVGCCWALMMLLFVGGVMNPIWILALATIVLLEKIAAQGALIGKAGGVLLLLWGGATLLV